MATTTSMLDSETALEVIHGETKELELTVVDSSGEKFDLTGASIYLTVKCKVSDTNNVLQLTSTPAAGIVFATDPRDGTATITFTVANTSQTPGTYIYDIWLVESGGERHVLIGPEKFKVVRGVTRLP
jgi:hypothetical protein